MRIDELQQVCGKPNVVEPYNSQVRRFNLAVLLSTLLVAGAGIALLALFWVDGAAQEPNLTSGVTG